MSHAAHANPSQAITLFYSDHRPEDAAFLDELALMSAESPTFQLVATMTEADVAADDRTGERGRIDAAMLHRPVRSPIYYVAGPSPMVTAMRHLLGSMEIPAQDVRFEEFRGY